MLAMFHRFIFSFSGEVTSRTNLFSNVACPAEVLVMLSRY
jgi:hypothetical protein